MQNNGKILNEQQLKNLENHKYSSSGTTILDKYFQIWWNLVVSFCPSWLAPNTITVVGLLFNIAGTMTLLYYCPTATETAPRWCWLFNAVCLFVYQTLDAIDGKQARKTGNSSPLGELFDHGCDSISMVMVTMNLFVMYQTGSEPGMMVLASLINNGGFYLAHWATYTTGKLQFSSFDVTEAQLATYSLYLFTYFFGQDSFHYTILGICTLKQILFYGLTFTSIILLFNSHGKTVLEDGAGPEGSSVAGTSVLSPSKNLFVVLILSSFIAAKPDIIMTNYPTLFVFFVGMVFAKCSNILIVAHMTKSEVPFIGKSCYGLLLIFLSQYFNITSIQPILLFCSVAHIIFDLVQYLCRVYTEIADRLQVRVFKVKPVKSE